MHRDRAPGDGAKPWTCADGAIDTHSITAAAVATKTLAARTERLVVVAMVKVNAAEREHHCSARTIVHL